MDTAEKLGEFETRPGVTYATHDSVALAGDLYLPKGAGPFPALVGVHDGIFQQHLGPGVKLTTSVFKSGGEVISALFSGAIDASYIGSTPAINGFAKSECFT